MLIARRKMSIGGLLVDRGRVAPVMAAPGSPDNVQPELATLSGGAVHKCQRRWKSRPDGGVKVYQVWPGFLVRLEAVSSSRPDIFGASRAAAVKDERGPDGDIVRHRVSGGLPGPSGCWFPAPFPTPVGIPTTFLTSWDARRKPQDSCGFAGIAWGFAAVTNGGYSLSVAVSLQSLGVGRFTPKVSMP